MVTRIVISGLLRRTRRPARTTLGVAAAVAAIASTVLVAAPKAHADGGIGFTSGIAVEASTMRLSTDLPNSVINNTSLNMWPGTSPAITSLTSAGTDAYQIAFEANTSSLWTTGTLGTGDLGLGMMPGTSPSITGLTYGGYQIAFQANTGDLWTVGSDGTVNWGLPMNPHSSPSITAQPGGGYEVAYQANTNELRIAGTTTTGGLRLGMQPGTSPSITTTVSGGYQIAFQANTGTLWVAGTLGTGNSGQGMDPHSSPSITSVLTFSGVAPTASGGYQVAFEANTDQLITIGSLGNATFGLAMQPGTSPSITGLDDPLLTGSSLEPQWVGYEIASQANTGTLWTTVSRPISGTVNSNTGLAMNASSSPSITPFTQ